MQQTPRRYVTAATVAVLGAGFIAATPVVAPDVGQPAVELAAAGDIIDLTSPLAAVVSSLGGADGSPLPSVIDALTSVGGALNGALSDELPDASSLLSVAADSAQADPLGDFLNIIFWGGLFLFGGIFATVGHYFQDAWEWIAGAFGFDPYPAEVEALGTGLPDIDVAGAVDPALAAQADAVLGDITLPFIDQAGVVDSTDLIQDLAAAVDPSAIPDLDMMFDPAAVADVGTMLSGLIPEI